jgi:hypothetical protein
MCFLSRAPNSWQLSPTPRKHVNRRVGLQIASESNLRYLEMELIAISTLSIDVEIIPRKELCNLSVFQLHLSSYMLTAPQIEITKHQNAITQQFQSVQFGSFCNRKHISDNRELFYTQRMDSISLSNQRAPRPLRTSSNWQPPPGIIKPELKGPQSP